MTEWTSSCPFLLRNPPIGAGIRPNPQSCPDDDEITTAHRDSIYTKQTHTYPLPLSPFLSVACLAAMHSTHRLRSLSSGPGTIYLPVLPYPMWCRDSSNLLPV